MDADGSLVVAIAYVLCRKEEEPQRTIFSKLNRAWNPNAALKKPKVEALARTSVHPMVTRTKSSFMKEPPSSSVSASERRPKEELISQIDVPCSSSTALNPGLLVATLPSTSHAAPKTELLRCVDIDCDESRLEVDGLPQNVTADLLLVRMSSIKLTREIVAEWKRLLALLQCVVKSYTEGNCRFPASSVRTAKALARFLADTLAQGIKHAHAVSEYTVLFAETMSKLCQFALLNNGTALEMEFCGLFREPLRQWFLNRAVRSTRAQNSWYSTRQLLHVMITSLSYNDLVLTVKEVISRTAADILQGTKTSPEHCHVQFALSELDALNAFATQHWQTTVVLPMTNADASPLRSQHHAPSAAVHSVDIPGDSKAIYSQQNTISNADVPGPSGFVTSSSRIPSTSLQKKRPGDQADGLGGKRARTLEGISLDELRQYVGTLDSYWDLATNQFDCPICGAVVKSSKADAKAHLTLHLRDNSAYQYKCPAGACDFSRMELGKVGEHVRNVHGLKWREELKLASVNPTYKAQLGSIMKH